MPWMVFIVVNLEEAIMIRFSGVRACSVRQNSSLILCGVLFAFSVFGPGCGKRGSDSPAQTSQQQDQFLDALEKLPPASRSDYVAQHSKERQAIMDGGDSARRNRMMSLMQP